MTPNKEVSGPSPDEEEKLTIILPFSQIPGSTAPNEQTAAEQAHTSEGERSGKVAVAKERLEKEGFEVKQTSPHQLKVDCLNFWPAKGTITVDGENTPRRGQSIDEVVRLLRKQGYR